jgi:pectin methylesterase-like acyl-CoA thioesterase
VKRALLAAAIILYARAALCGTIQYYVSTSGNDSTGTGLSSASPWRTIQHAVDSYNQNSLAVINIAAGTYGEAVVINTPLMGSVGPGNNALTCQSGVVYTTSVTVNVAGWTVSSCINMGAGPTATATSTPAPTATQTPVPTQTPTPTPTPAACTINKLGTVISVDAKGTLRCATPTATP